MHLTGIKLGGVPPFTEPITLRFDERVNVFIGPNASGKSTLLLALADHFLRSSKALANVVPWERLIMSEFPDDEFEEFVQEDPEANVISVSEDWFDVNYGNFRSQIAPCFMYVGTVREGLPGISNQPNTNEYGDTASEALNGAFSGSRTIISAKMLGEERWSDEEDGKWYPKRGSLLKAIEIAGYCSKQICDEVIRESRLQNYIPGPDVRGYLAHPFADTRRITVLSLMGVDTTDKRNFEGLNIWEKPSSSAYKEDPDSLPIYLGHLSSGTQGTLLWILWLSLKLVQHYDFEQGWDKKPAILLIDEIENHLHPTWQRRVIPALLEHFPGLQILATTHSPFVVAGLKAGQVHKLDRDANGIVKATTEARDVVGWTMDEILRGMMGVDDPTDAETARAAAELRQLRSGEPKTDKKEEELRQQRIQELRSVVDRDLLAGGPVAAQRELFERNLVDILEEHRKAQGLNQD